MNKKESKEKKEKVSGASCVACQIPICEKMLCSSQSLRSFSSPTFVHLCTLFVHFCASCHNIFFIHNDKTTTKS